MSPTGTSFAAALFLTLSAAGAGSQTISSDEYADAIVRAGQNTIDHLKEVFRPHLDPQDRHHLDGDRIRIKRFADFNAFFGYQDGTIVIPAAMAGEIQAQVQAHIYIKNNPGSAVHLNDWLISISRRSLDAYKRFARREAIVDDIPFVPFWSYAKLRPPPPLEAADAQLQQAMITDALAFVIAHELGHLINRHKPYNAITPVEARRQENAADDFAVQLLFDSDMSILPAISIIFGRFMMAEFIGQTYDNASSTHPYAPCRLYRILSLYLEDDPVVIANRSPRNPQIAEFMKIMRSHCRSETATPLTP